MRKRFLGLSVAGVLVFLLASFSVSPAQRTRKPAATAPAAPVKSDLKITYRTTSSGQPMETTTMLKGARERSEMKLGYGRDIINVTQCDLKRTIQISDSARKYVITPMETVEATPRPATAGGPSEPSRRGGVVTYTTTAVDTGERKEMFGFQARHVKTTMVIESSPDACNPMKQRMETDGWYIDFSFGLNCDVGHTPMAMPSARGGGCRDTVRFNRQGAARTGYALQETTTSYGPDGRVAFSSTKEVVELSREPLDAALFDIPPGYVEAASTQELYAMPSMAEMTSQMAKGQSPADDDRTNSANSNNAKASGGIRVGVVQINNRTDRSISQDALRGRLLAEIQEQGVAAVALNAISPREAEVEAKAKQCDFILYTDVTALKTSAAKKVGGFLGRATGIGSGGVDKTEAKIEFQLFAVGETTVRLRSSATAKEEGEETSVGTALSQEANQVSAEMRKKRGG
ncbi:MAG TPA: hypothetical protein VGO68_17820 [Pyrinomonadaceae bacterium]|jgi:hypothetical protein|nr:hypothetical protein [Pyrinomonadaceae bacterium]